MAPIISHKPFSHLLTVAFIFCLIIILPPKSGLVVGIGASSSISSDHDDHYYQEEATKKMVLGSRPPRCVNKCLNCRPCTATLVIPSHQKKRLDQTSSHREDDSYYLLSWKCTCGNKLFHP